MAIRFACPSCQQPIEIDDAWAGQSVACPYCRRVITAPAQSNWPAGQIPVAAPAGPNVAGPSFGPPPPPQGHDPLNAMPAGGACPVPAGPPRGGSAGWALCLSVTSAICCLIGFLIWMGTVLQIVVAKAGPNPNEQQVQKLLQEMVISKTLPVIPAATMFSFVGAFCGIAAIAMAARCLVRRESRAVLAVIALVIAVIFVLCQLFLMFVMASSHA